MVLGLVPDCELEQVEAAGNAAGTGALIALLSANARREIETQVRRVEKIETAVEPRFQEHFVAAMAIPHKTAANPNLARVVDLPARTPPTPGRGTGAPADAVVPRPPYDYQVCCGSKSRSATSEAPSWKWPRTVSTRCMTTRHPARGDVERPR